MANILDEIIAHKRKEIEAAKEQQSEVELQGEALLEGLKHRELNKGASMGLIAEMKAKSPSKGDIRPGFDPSQLATEFEANGASAISVLTDEKYFGGSLDNLKAAKAATSLPVLRKDFIIDPYQIYETKAAGADMVLLIASAASENLPELVKLAAGVGLQVLIEVHTREELEYVLAQKFYFRDVVIGINNRDLATFRTDINTSLELGKMIPNEFIRIAESGVENEQQLRQLSEAGFDSVLIGEGLARNPELFKFFKAADSKELKRL